jgi:tetratricopeptide (TPR) repeat protein
MRALAILLVVVVGTTVAHAQQPQQVKRDERDAGFIGKGPSIPRLEVEDCPVVDPAMTQEQIQARGRERYDRGETLYIQGDYEGAVHELVGSYCLIRYYSILKDIGQAYERKLDYERAIGYLSKYISEIPKDAQRVSSCAPDPQEDRENVSRRIRVLSDLKAQVFVQVDVPQTELHGQKAKVTIQNDAGVASRGFSGDTLEVPAGVYDIIIDLDGYQQLTEHETIQIGKPYTFFYHLPAMTGTLSIQASPEDARIFIEDQFAGVGRAEKLLKGGHYHVMIEAQGRLTDRREIDVLANRVNRVQVSLPPLPQFGRRQLIAYAATASGVATGGLLYAFQNTGIAGAGLLAGAGAGLLGSVFYLPDEVPLGTSNLTVTVSIASAVVAANTALVFTDDPAKVSPIAGASLIVGGGLGYYVGRRTNIRVGDAALINSALLWGTMTGTLFAVSFDPPTPVASGLVLSGLGMGAISGVLMTRYFDISRTHAILIDIGGIAGIIGGLATESILHPNDNTPNDPTFSDAKREHIANYALAGMAVGLVAAGVLSRNIDSPGVPVQLRMGAVTDAGGKTTTTYGFGGDW